MTARRDDLVEAALEIIREAGLGSFTQPRVAARAGLRQSHLTYYFPTRDDLLAAVAAEAVRRRVALLEPVISADGPAAKVEALTTVLVAPGQTRVLLALTQSADLDPDVRASMADLGRALVPVGTALLTAFGAPVDATSLDALQTTSTGIAVLALLQGGEAFRPRGEAALTALLHGLAATTSTTPPGEAGP